MQIDKDTWVSLLEMDTLWEEHRRITVGVECEDSAMQTFGHMEVCCLLHKPAEKRQSAFQPFGMPLHAKDRLVFTALNSLDHSIGCGGYHAET